VKNNSEESPRSADTFDMRKTYVRWVMLGLACCFLLGSYFCYDNPGPLETQLERDFHMNSATYALLYTVYSAPNMVLPIFGVCSWTKSVSEQDWFCSLAFSP